MTLDDVINKLVEAKEHCVPGDTQVHVWRSNCSSLTEKDKLEGTLWWIDYDNVGVNLYFDNNE